jgi:ATP-dependent protease ClpP protease subunit
MIRAKERSLKQFIYYHGTVNISGIRNLETLLTEAVKHETPDITLCICSGGGDVCAGIGAYNFIKMLPVPITTYTFGMCGSIAATFFLAGTKRVAAFASMFTLHAASYSEGPRKGEVSENTELICYPFRQALAWSDEQIQKYFSSPAEQFITPQMALEMSMITQIADLRISHSDEIIHVHIP